jgi:hypothetical protein
LSTPNFSMTLSMPHATAFLRRYCVARPGSCAQQRKGWATRVSPATRLVSCDLSITGHGRVHTRVKPLRAHASSEHLRLRIPSPLFTAFSLRIFGINYNKNFPHVLMRAVALSRRALGLAARPAAAAAVPSRIKLLISQSHPFGTCVRAAV